MHVFENVNTDGFSVMPSFIETSHKLIFSDKLGALKVRFGFGRMKYTVLPGLYRIGTPTADSPVLVTANYKLSFDHVRKSLEAFNAWILVLDTKGVNVWCAAGKGSFGTEELVNKIRSVNLAAVVRHKTLILPQLAGPGVAAHLVRKQTGFKVIYGPVRASDIKTFILNGYQATLQMRTVTFDLKERIVLVPVEMIPPMKKSMMLFGLFFILNSFGFGQFSAVDLWAFWGSIVVGAGFVPILLPYIPGNAFSIKGSVLGGVWVLAIIAYLVITQQDQPNLMHIGAFITLLPTISAYLAMNFTGASTYTSFSGVKKEMKIALPIMLLSSGIGTILLIIEMLTHRG